MRNRGNIAYLAVCTAACASVLALAGCGKTPVIPSTVEVIGKTEVEGVKALVLRDTGTGCEMIAVPGVGLMPRNERSVDGLTVKQRCITTGDEQPTPASAAAVPAGQTSTFAPAVNPVGPDAQEQAVREAVRSQTEGAIPPAAPPPAPTIPPPKGVTKSTPVAPADDGDGVESQLKQ